MGSFDVPLSDERTQLEAFVEEYRRALESTLDGLTDEQARSRLVPSATTLLGLLKHVTWMQRVWFEECVGGTRRLELGLVQSPDESFQLADDDTDHQRAGGLQAGLRDGPIGRGRPSAGSCRNGPSGRASHSPLGVPAGAARTGPSLRSRRHPAGTDPRWLSSEIRRQRSYLGRIRAARATPAPRPTPELHEGDDDGSCDDAGSPPAAALAG